MKSTRMRAAAVVAAVGTVLALLGVINGSAASAARAKIGPYELSSAPVTCTYGGRTLQTVTVPATRVSIDKRLVRAGERSQYVGIVLTLQGRTGSRWKTVATRGGTGARQVPITVLTHPSHYATLPAKKKARSFTHLGELKGYSAYRASIKLMWYAANGRHVRGKVSRKLTTYSTGGSSCAARLPASGRIAVSNTGATSGTVPAVATARISSTWPVAKSVTLSLRGPAQSAAGACASSELRTIGTYQVPAGGSFSLPEHEITAGGYFAWYVTSGSQSACSSESIGVAKAQPGVSWDLTSSGTLPSGSVGRATLSGNQGSFAGTFTLWRGATAAASACGGLSASTVATQAASSNGTVGLALHPGAPVGWYRWQYSSPETASQKAVSTCSNPIAASYGSLIARMVPGSYPHSAPAGTKVTVPFSVTFHGQSNNALDIAGYRLVVNWYNNTGCSGAVKGSLSAIGVSDLGATYTPSDKFAAPAGGSVLVLGYRAFLVPPAGGVQPQVASNCVPVDVQGIPGT